MHPDLFEKPGYGWHIGANPGASMLGAIPYAASRPRAGPHRGGGRIAAAPTSRRRPVYNSPWPLARQVLRGVLAARLRREVRAGGDYHAGLLHGARSPRWRSVAMFYLLRRVFASDRTGFWLALLYAFGTPVFFRTGYLNHNLMLGEFAFMGFLAMWNPGGSRRIAEGRRIPAGGTDGRHGAADGLLGRGVSAGPVLYGMAKAGGLGAIGRMVRLSSMVCGGHASPGAAAVVVPVGQLRQRLPAGPELDAAGRMDRKRLSGLHPAADGACCASCCSITATACSSTCPLLLLALLVAAMEPRRTALHRRGANSRCCWVCRSPCCCSAAASATPGCNTIPGFAIWRRCCRSCSCRPRWRCSRLPRPRAVFHRGRGGGTGLVHGDVPGRGARLGRARPGGSRVYRRLSTPVLTVLSRMTPIRRVHRRGRFAAAHPGAGRGGDLRLLAHRNRRIGRFGSCPGE